MQLKLRLVMIAISAICLSFITSVSFGQAIVTSDQADYAPRSNAVFTGSGFLPYESVLLKVKNLDRPCNTVTADSSYLPWVVKADSNGAFVSDWLVCDCLGDSLRLKAQGQTSGFIAYAYFTDGNLRARTNRSSTNVSAVFYSTVNNCSTGGGNPTNFTVGTLFTPIGAASASQSFSLTADPFSVEGGILQGWTGDATSSSLTVCVPGTSNPGNISMTANYATCTTPPTATLTSSDANNTICAGDEVTFTANSVAGATYIFYINGEAQGPASPTNSFSTSLLTNGQVVTVRVINSLGCSKLSAGISTTVNALPTLTVQNLTTACFGGTVNLTSAVVSNTGSLSYFQSNGTTAVSDPSAVSAGNYIIKATSNGCTTSKSVTVSQPGQLNATVVVTPTATKCFGSSDGEILVTLSDTTGGSGTYNIGYIYERVSPMPVLTYGPVSQNNITTFQAGTYKVTVRIYDAANMTCYRDLVTNNVVVADAPQLNATLSATTTPTTCFNTATGTIDLSVTPSGGSGKYFYGYTWTRSGGSPFPYPFEDIPTVEAGTYSVTVRVYDSLNMSCYRDVILNNVVVGSAAQITATATPSVISCPGAATGTITVSNAAGGSGEYQYSINGEVWQNEAVFSNLTADTYQVLIRDKNAVDCIIDLDGEEGTVITELDVTPPTAIAKNITVNLSATGTAAIEAADIDNGSSDECGAAVTLAAGKTSFSCSDLGTNNVTLTVTDASGNTSTANAVVTIKDVTAPLIGAAGANATINCPSEPEFTAPTASDECSGATVNIVSTTTGGTACARTHTRVWQAVDGCSNVSVTRSQTITVVDVTAPTIGNAGANATINCPSEPEFTAPTASDECSGATVNIVSTTTGGTACARTHTRVWQAVDGCSNVSVTRSQTITVVDVTAPLIGAAGANATINCPSEPEFTAPTASDECSGATVNIVSTTTGGTACARTHTRVWQAVDGCSNVSVTRSQTITVVDVTAPTIGNAGANATINCPSEPEFTAPTASDECSGATVNIVSTTTGGTACARTHTRVWQAVDGCSNVSVTRSQTITVVDVTAPTIGNAGANATINCPSEPEFTAPTASDECSGATVNIVSTTTGGTACARTHTRVWQAVDGCSNVSVTRSQTITVVDVTAPTIGNAGANATINCPSEPEFTAPTASDECSGATVNIVSTTTGGTACARTHTRVWQAVDGCSNVSVTRSQTITVVDVTAPTIGNAGANATINCPSEPEFTAPTASDECSGATVNIVSTTTGGTACARTHTRVWQAVDGCSNVSVTRSQTITVVDVTAPTIGNAGANATINCPSEPEFTAPTASDECSGATVNIVSTTTGGTACARTHTRVWQAVDGCSNVSVTRSQTITVVDVTAPTIGNAGANATINCPSEPEFTAPTASDECSGATVNIVSTTTGGTACARTHTRVWQAVDGCSNVSVTRSQTITVVDVTAPTIGNAGANATINCPSEPEFTAPTASDECSGATVNIVSTTTGGTACARTHTRVWQAVDGCSNVSVTRSQTITVVDVTAPTIGNAGANATINCPSEPEFTAPTASDECSGATVNIVSTTTGGTACARTHTRVWQAVDGCSNVSVTRSQTITVVDVTAPTIGNAGANATINCPSEPEFTAPTASDECSGATVNIVSTTTGGTACARTHTRVWQAVDGCSNVSVTRSQTITVVDVTAPTIGNAGANATINCPSEPEFTAPTASDECSGATVNIVSTTTGGTACARTHTRVWQAVDGCSNVSVTRSQTITVVDVTAPTIGNAGANATINCPSEPEFTAPTASDECSGATVNIVSTTTGGTACARTHTRVWQAVDGCSNVSVTRSQTITVVDVTAPTIGNAGANATINCPSEPEFTAPTASDECSGATVNIVSTTTGGTACARTHTRVWQAVDGCSNVSVTRSQTITVVDVTAPTIGNAGANATINCPSEPEFTAPTASDECSGATVNIVSTTTGGTACARTHTRVWQAVDGCSNVSVTRSQTITVVDVTAPTIGNAGANATINCPSEPEFTAPTASDECSGATVNIVSTTTGGTACARTHTRVWQAVDGCSNVSVTRSQTITVVDVTAPLIGAAGANATINCPSEPEFTAPTASDECSGATVNIVSTTTGGTACARTHTRVWQAVDGCSNVSVTRSQTITVVDVTAPTIGNAGANATINCPSEPEFTAPTASDECSGATVNIVSTTTGGTACARTHTRVWQAVDGCSNVSVTRSQTITVVDVTAPVVSAPTTIDLECAGDLPPAVTTIGGFNALAGASASDNCTATASLTVSSSDVVTTPGNCNGVITRTYTITDACNNSTTVNQVFTITDNTRPRFTAPTTVDQSCLWPPNHKMRTVVVRPSITDNCATPSWVITSVRSNEPVNGIGDGDTEPDWIIDGQNLQLRAERQGTGNGRVYTVFVTATDGCGNTAVDSVNVYVAHNIHGPGNGNSVKVGSVVNFAGTFWDVAGNKHTAKWLVDGATVATGTVVEPVGTKNGAVTGSYKFTTPGVYRLRMNVTDQKGVTSYATTNGALDALVVVYDPNGGFTVGSGSFTSPKGAIPSNPTATPKISYGFQSNYYKGATNPKGETQFDFDAGDFQFNALNFDYLVVNKSFAQFKGSGKISNNNGTIQSGVSFVMTVIDGQVTGGGGIDKIRMKIFNKNTGQVYYDNQPGSSDADYPVTAVDMGSVIQITSTDMSVTTAPVAVAKQQVAPEEEIHHTTELNLKAYPNPSTSQFTLKLEGDDNKGALGIRVTDISGKVIEVKNYLLSGQTIQIGHNYRPGMYIVELWQNTKRKQIKLVKLPD